MFLSGFLHSLKGARNVWSFAFSFSKSYGIWKKKKKTSIFLWCFINQRLIYQGLWDLSYRNVFYRNYKGEHLPVGPLAINSPILPPSWWWSAIIPRLTFGLFCPSIPIPTPYSALPHLVPYILQFFLDLSLFFSKKSTTKSFSGKSYLEKRKISLLNPPAPFFSLRSFLPVPCVRSQCHSLHPLFSTPSLGCSSVTNSITASCDLWGDSTVSSFQFFHHFSAAWHAPFLSPLPCFPRDTSPGFPLSSLTMPSQFPTFSSSLRLQTQPQPWLLQVPTQKPHPLWHCTDFVPYPDIRTLSSVYCQHHDLMLSF